MTTLRYFRCNDGCAPVRNAPQSPAVQCKALRRAGVRRTVARALRVAGEGLFGLWVLAALAFCSAVAVGLTR